MRGRSVGNRRGKRSLRSASAVVAEEETTPRSVRTRSSTAGRREALLVDEPPLKLVEKNECQDEAITTHSDGCLKMSDESSVTTEADKNNESLVEEDSGIQVDDVNNGNFDAVDKRVVVSFQDPSGPGTSHEPNQPATSTSTSEQPNTSQRGNPQYTQTRVVYYSKPDFSTLTAEERAKLKDGLKARMEEIFPICQFGNKYKRLHPPFPPSAHPEDAYPRQILQKDPDGVIRRIEYRPATWRAEDEEGVAAGKLDFIMPTGPTPSFLEMIAPTLPKGSVSERLRKNNTPNDSNNQDEIRKLKLQMKGCSLAGSSKQVGCKVDDPKPSTSKPLQDKKSRAKTKEPKPGTFEQGKEVSESGKTADEPQPSTSKQAFMEAKQEQAKRSESNNPYAFLTDAELEDYVLKSGKMPPYHVFMEATKDSPELGDRLVKMTTGFISEAMERQKIKKKEELEAACRAKEEKRRAIREAKLAQRQQQLELLRMNPERRTRSSTRAPNEQPLATLNLSPVGETKPPNGPQAVCPPLESQDGNADVDKIVAIPEADLPEKEETLPVSSSLMTTTRARRTRGSNSTRRNSRGLTKCATAATEDAEDTAATTVKSGCPLDNATGWVKDDVWEVESILTSKFEDGKNSYNVKWKGWDSEHNSWILEEDFVTDGLLKEYWRKHSKISIQRNRKMNKPVAADEPTSFTYFFC